MVVGSLAGEVPDTSLAAYISLPTLAAYISLPSTSSLYFSTKVQSALPQKSRLQFSNSNEFLNANFTCAYEISSCVPILTSFPLTLPHSAGVLERSAPAPVPQPTAPEPSSLSSCVLISQSPAYDDSPEERQSVSVANMYHLDSSKR